MKHRLSNGVLATIIIVVAVLVDQILKLWVKTSFFYGEEVKIAEWFRLVFIENNGMAFGMELGSKFFLTWFRIIAVVLLIWYLLKCPRAILCASPSSRLVRWAMSSTASSMA